MEVDIIQKELRQYLEGRLADLDEKQVRGLLSDYMPTRKLERNLLISLFVEGITRDVELIEHNSKKRFLVYIKCMEDDYGIRKDKAIWAVLTWCYILGCDMSSFSQLSLSLGPAGMQNQEQIQQPKKSFNKEGFTFYFNKHEIQSLNELQYELSISPIEAKKYLKRGLIAEYFKTIRPDIASITMDAMEAISSGQDEDKVFLRYILKLDDEYTRSHLFIWKDIRCENIDEIFHMFAEHVSSFSSNHTKNKHQTLEDLLLKNAISFYMELINVSSTYIRTLEDEYRRAGDDNKILIFYRLAMLDADYKKMCEHKFRDIDQRINKEIDKSIYFVDAFLSTYEDKESVNFNQFVALFLSLTHTNASPVIAGDKESKRGLFLNCISTLLRKKGAWIPTKDIQYQLRKYKPIKRLNENLTIRKFVNINDPHMVFCPIHNCRLGIMEVSKPTNYTLSAFETLTLKYCPECKSFVMSNKDNVNGRNITYISDSKVLSKDQIIEYACKECGKRINMPIPLSEDYCRQGIALPTRCSLCERHYRKLKERYPLCTNSLF